MRRNTEAAADAERGDHEVGEGEHPERPRDRHRPDRPAAAPRSAAIMTRRASVRSTQAPAGRPTTSQGSQAAAVSRPIQPAPASKTVTATSGTTTEVVIEPSTDTPSPTQSSRKLRLPAIGGAAAGRSCRRLTAGSGSRGRRRRPARGARRRRAPRGCPSGANTVDDLVGDLPAARRGSAAASSGVAKAASSHSGAVSALASQSRTRSCWRRTSSASASCAAVTAAWSTRSRRLHRVPVVTRRHHRSRRSRASSGASSTSPAAASTLRWWLALPTAWPVRAASMDAVDGPSTLSASMIRERNGWASAASGAASRRVRTSGRVMSSTVTPQQSLHKKSCAYLARDVRTLRCTPRPRSSARPHPDHATLTQRGPPEPGVLLTPRAATGGRAPESTTRREN